MYATIHEGVQADKVVLRKQFFYFLFELDICLVEERKKASLHHSVEQKEQKWS